MARGVISDKSMPDGMVLKYISHQAEKLLEIPR